MAKDTNTDNKRKDHSRRNRNHPKSPVARKERRRAEAEARQAEYDALSTEEKIAKAEAAPGSSLREILRLVPNIEERYGEK